MSDAEAATPKRTITDRLLAPFSDVKNGEGGTALVMLFTIFLLLLSYYILKTVREPLIAASASQMPLWMSEVLDEGGAQLKAVAAAFQAALLVVFVPAYSWIASKVSRIRLIVGVSLFFVACIQLFFILGMLNVPMVGFFFYIWVGIFSVAMIAQFWSFGNDIYSEDQGNRLFPIIGVGATAGSPVGAKVAGFLFDYLSPGVPDEVMVPGEKGGEKIIHDATQLVVRDVLGDFVSALGLPPEAASVGASFIILQIAAVLLLLSMATMVLVARRFDGPTAKVEDAAKEAKAAEKEEAAPKKAGPGGFTLLLKSPYLRLIGAVILLLNVVNTTGELLLTDLVIESANAAEAAGEVANAGAYIGSFYGDFFFYVNIIALVLQAFIVSRLVKFLGLKGVLFALPILAVGVYGVFAAGLGLGVVRWAKSAENATDYSIMNTGKALVWLKTSREAKYSAKQAVDTFIVRMGDVGAALLFLIGTIALGWGVQAIAAVNLFFVALWLFATFALLKRYQAISDDPSVDPLATGITETPTKRVSEEAEEEEASKED